MAATNKRKLASVHHKWLRRIIGVSCKDNITKEKIREITGTSAMEELVRL
jgi:hypothetical protein